MADDRRPPETKWAAQAARKERRKKASREAGDTSVWFGLGMMGLVGWSVAIPTVVGALLGYWIDEAHPGQRSWTLMGIVLGVLVGALNAWRWMHKEGAHKDTERKP